MQATEECKHHTTPHALYTRKHFLAFGSRSRNGPARFVSCCSEKNYSSFSCVMFHAQSPSVLPQQIPSGNEQYRERIFVCVYSECIHALLHQRWAGQRSHEELCDCCVERAEEGDEICESDCSMEVGITCGETHVLVFDEYAEKLKICLTDQWRASRP